MRLFWLLVFCVSGCAIRGERLPDGGSGEAQISDAKSLLRHLGLEADIDELGCLEPPLMALARKNQPLLGNDEADFARLKERIYLRTEADLAVTDIYYTQPPACDRDAVWVQIEKIRLQNAEFLNTLLTVESVESLARDPRTLGSIDVIARHYVRDLPDGTNAAERLKSIYAELLPSGSIDPLSYAGIVDALSIRKSGMQVYGSYVSCDGDRWRYDPPIVDEENLEERRSLIMGGKVWSDPPGDLCGQ